MTTFEVRKRDELHSKLAGFFDEMVEWRHLTDKHAPLEKHYSQVRALTSTLDALAEKVKAQIDSADDIRGQWKQLEREVVALHTVWAFYRDKWALRQLEKFKQYLILADEYAWASYKPVQDAFREADQKATGKATRKREPPLVFLGPMHGPWSLARGDSGQDDLDEELVKNTVVQGMVRRLPLPVVAVAWQQLSHLPDAVVIGHEVGHVALVDFVGLDAVEDIVDTELLTQNAGDQERRAWAGWSEEAFADVYGVLCGGTAYAQTLGDLLISRGVENALADQLYPPPLLRMAVLAGALEEAVGTEEAQGLLDDWKGDGVLVSAAGGHELATCVGQALVRGKYPSLGGALDTFISPKQVVATKEPSERLLNRMAPGTDEIRMLVAATVTAFRSKPDTFRDRGVQKNILRTAEKIQSPGYRFAAEPSDQGEESAPDEVDELWRLLSSTGPTTPDTREADHERDDP
ncbi:MAG: hypothetical protein JWR85_1691 [Marmoricola sp.]|nr:hypothetical protein [Marmoricola sp.]